MGELEPAGRGVSRTGRRPAARRRARRARPWHASTGRQARRHEITLRTIRRRQSVRSV